ncbi:MAG: ABC transporter ATP-binding protein [Ruminococcus sp.]|nr:ABC transporter ATP-binding protein [Ruminococcus sp.]
MSEYIVDVDKVTIRFNKASENIDNLKEYFVKLVKGELMFKEFLALRDIDLKIRPGEAWAIIGTNGSGKSTLLKVISRILKPYKGSVKVNGTVASLIELGAGIDPKLTARENIYLNGCILGYSKAFIDERFDEIVEFSELEDFLDTPVKNFSSGMKSRLGFSVATMVKPDILIVDEVLSVGDLLFRKKCMNKMNEMLSQGTTLLFVSHNMDTCKAMCDYALWLNKGEVVMSGDIETVANEYTTTIEERKAKEKAARTRKKKAIEEKAKAFEEQRAQRRKDLGLSELTFNPKPKKKKKKKKKAAPEAQAAEGTQTDTQPTAPDDTNVNDNSTQQ